MKSKKITNIAIIGGGASGIFASLRCAEIAKENNIKADIRVFESSNKILKKVKISGGGRCNVTHHKNDAKDLCLNYPRGEKEMLSPFTTFKTTDTVKWFRSRGVKLKYEDDGRMFPITDDSKTIINCFIEEAEKYKVKIITKSNIKNISKLEDEKFSLRLNENNEYIANSVLIATGSKTSGYKLAQSLGHTITELAPSLFTFNIDDPIIKNLQGTSFLNSHLTLQINNKKPFYQNGPLLITHWGLSGPALLKLSAWSAREMMNSNYKAKIIVNWLGINSKKDTEDLILVIKKRNSRNNICNAHPKDITKRFWIGLLKKCKISEDKKWAEISNREIDNIIKNLFNCELSIHGKSRFKDEFVECGGVNLKEINFRTMESKICQGLYFSGEVIDVDGITGGFNFQNAWTTGWIAGTNMVL